MNALSGSELMYERVTRWFPVPSFLLPDSIGLDISDTSIKWLACKKGGHCHEVATYGSRSIPAGILSGGIIKDSAALVTELKEIRKQLKGYQYVHAALPEEIAYIFSMQVPRGIPHDEIMKLVEFEFEGRVPISPEQAVYDYDVIIEHKNDMREIGVTAFPKEAAEAYAAAITAAGFTPVSLEIEARSIARAVIPQDSPPDIALLVDFGRARTGFALVKRGIPVFTTTVNVGGDAVTQVIMQELGISEREAEEYKNERGILDKPRHERDKALLAMQRTVGALSDEIARHFHFWDTRRNAGGEKMAPVGKVIIVGGNANIKGLTDFIAQTVHAETHRGNVWENICTFEYYIPPIAIHQSLEYATAAGLAQRGL